MKSLIVSLIRDERGLESVEYAVLTALMVAGLVAAVTALSGAIHTRYGAITTTLNGLL